MIPTDHKSQHKTMTELQNTYIVILFILLINAITIFTVNIIKQTKNINLINTERI